MSSNLFQAFLCESEDKSGDSINVSYKSVSCIVTFYKETLFLPQGLLIQDVGIELIYFFCSNLESRITILCYFCIVELKNILIQSDFLSEIFYSIILLLLSQHITFRGTLESIVNGHSNKKKWTIPEMLAAKYLKEQVSS